MKKVKFTHEFKKLGYCLELLAIKDIIADKRKLLKNKIFKWYSEEEYHEEELEELKELKEFIYYIELLKETIIKKVYKLTGLSYDEAIKFAKENKENNIRLYNLHYANSYNYILYSIRGKEEEYLELCKGYRKEAEEIFESLVTE